MDPVKQFGFTALPRDPKTILNGKDNVHSPQPVLVKDIVVPSTALAKAIQQYAKAELAEETFNHSMRVYFYGKAILQQQFPDWDVTDETYFLTCLLHDIGTTKKNLRATLMSFEFFGGLLALDLLEKQHKAPKEQAESVAEAIIRHQDIGETGKITTIGQIIQLATIFDNMGGHAALVHHDTIVDVVKHYPRNKWSSCFAATIREENGLKPWAHTTALGEEDFPNGVLNNKLMQPFE
ncbi:MAG: H(+)-transporting V1 sector ATPase subunit H [Chaenotheca gracillima]|nr:MAG: H(+)-transporting V1 sector ATPase subunit H [Chaenotheca gracillima]